MVWVLEKASSPGWEKEFPTREDALDELGSHLCSDCVEEARYDRDSYLSTPCGCEFWIEEMTGMASVVADVRAFHKGTGSRLQSSPSIPEDPAWRRMLWRLVDEEYRELRDAVIDRDITQIAKEGADLVYVVVGLMVAYGIPFDRVWDEVQRSNMAKIDPVTGTVHRRTDGKTIKPPGWTAPDIDKILKEAA